MTTRLETALARLKNQFQGKEILEAFLTALYTRIQDSDALITYLRGHRHLGDAEGYWLDLLGKIVGAWRPLEEIDNDDYFEIGDEYELTNFVETGSAITRMSGLGSCAAPDGSKSYYTYSDGSVYKVDHTSHAVTYIDNIGDKSECMVLGPDNKIYIAPRSGSAFYRIDPSTDTIASIGSIASSATNTRFYIILVVGTAVYYIPFGDPRMVKYETSTSTLSQVGYTWSVDTGVSSIEGAVVYGNYIYMFPSSMLSTPKVYKHDTTTDTGAAVGATFPGSLYPRFRTAKVIGSYIYALPAKADANNDHVIKFDPSTDTWSQVGASLLSIMGSGTDAWRRSIVYDGKLYGVPCDADSFIEHDPTTDTWAQVGSLDYAAATIYRPLLVDGERVVGCAYGYNMFWEFNLSDFSSEFTDLTEFTVQGYWFTTTECAASGFAMCVPTSTSAPLVVYSERGVYPQYDNGFADDSQTVGGMLRGLDGTWLDDETYIDDDDYEPLVEAGANTMFTGSSLKDMANYIFNTFGVTALIEFDEHSDYYVTLDSWLPVKQRRYLLKYAPIACCARAEIVNWPTEA